MKSFGQSSFAIFFKKFPILLIAGLLFAAPLAIFTGIFVLISRLSGFNNIILWGLGIIPAMPFYSGLVMVIRKISVEKDFSSPLKVFFSALKDNLKLSLINGAVTYIITACSFFAFLYYGTLAQTDVVYGSVLTLYIIFAAVLLVMMYYVPLLTVTYELKITDIYKNSFLLVFGKVLRNLVATVLIGAITALAVLAIVFATGIWTYVSGIIIAVLYPLITTYIINSIIAKGVQEAVGYFTGNDVNYSQTREEQELESIALQYADSDDDYVFVNGRFIKNPAKKS